MTLEPGSRLGRYEIRSKLGAGGMGEVYLAHDTGELERPVALKFLNPDIASAPERMRRFVKPGEIQSIAVLPFRAQNMSGSPEVEYLSDGMTESLINSPRNWQAFPEAAVARDECDLAGVTFRDVHVRAQNLRRSSASSRCSG